MSNLFGHCPRFAGLLRETHVLGVDDPRVRILVSVYPITFFFQFIFYKFKRPFIFFPNYQKITLIKTDDEKEFSISLNGVFNAEFCSL